MAGREARVMGWGAIIGILIAVAVGTGLLLGLLGEFVRLPTWAPSAGVGAAVGAVAGHLVARRRAALGRAGNKETELPPE